MNMRKIKMKFCSYRHDVVIRMMWYLYRCK